MLNVCGFNLSSFPNAKPPAVSLLGRPFIAESPERPTHTVELEPSRFDDILWSQSVRGV